MWDPKEPHELWNPFWRTYDVDNAFFNYLVNGKREVPDPAYPVILKFYNTHRHLAHKVKKKEKWTKDDSEIALFRHLDEHGAFNIIKSQYPVPVHFDPHCRNAGLGTKTILNEPFPDNFTLATANVNVANSTVDFSNTSILGADLKVTYDEVIPQSQTNSNKNLDKNLDPSKRTVFFTPNRQLLSWGAIDEKSGIKYFYTLLGIIVTVWILIFCYHYFIESNCGGTLTSFQNSPLYNSKPFIIGGSILLGSLCGMIL